jgi:hypothetical protein
MEKWFSKIGFNIAESRSNTAKSCLTGRSLFCQEFSLNFISTEGSHAPSRLFYHSLNLKANIGIILYRTVIL